MTPDQLVSAYKEANRDLLSQLNTTAAGRTANANIGGSSAAMDYFTRGLAGASDTLGRMTIGTQTAGDTIGTAGNIISAFTGKFGTAFTAFAEGTTRYAFAINESLKDVNKSGYTFDQNLGAFAKSISEAKMSIPEFQALIKDAGQQLIGIGSNANESGKTFLRIGAALQKDETVAKMQLLGVGFEEFNQVLKIEAAARRNLNIQNENVQRNLINATIETVREMDLVAQLTGRSRQDQQRQQQDMNRRTNVQLQRLAMTEQQQQAFTEAQKISRYLGPAGEEAALIAATGGAMNAEENRVMATLDPQMRSMLEQLVKVQGDSPEANARRDELRFQMEMRAAEMANNRQQLDLMGRLFRTGNPEEQARAQAYLQVAGGIGISIKKQQEEYEKLRSEGKTEFATFREYRNSVVAAEQARLAKAGTPEAGAGATPAQALNLADALQKDLNSAIAGVFKEGVETFGKAITSIDGLNMATLRFTNEGLKEFTEKIIASANNILTKTGVDVNKDKLGPGVGDRTRRRVEGFASGTKDVAGEWFQNFDPLGELELLHGEEAVVPKNKIGEFIRDMVSENPTLISGLRSGLNTVLSEQTPDKSVVQEFRSAIESMQSIATKVSPSTTVPNFADDTVMTELLRGIDKLNINMQAVRDAIEQGTDKNVRAFKSAGNMIP